MCLCPCCFLLLLMVMPIDDVKYEPKCLTYGLLKMHHKSIFFIFVLLHIDVEIFQQDCQEEIQEYHDAQNHKGHEVKDRDAAMEQIKLEHVFVPLFKRQNREYDNKGVQEVIEVAPGILDHPTTNLRVFVSENFHAKKHIDEDQEEEQDRET